MQRHPLTSPPSPSSCNSTAGARLAAMVLTVLISATTTGQVATVESPPAAPTLPDGHAILQQHIEAVGGADRMKNLKTILTKGEMTLAAIGVTAPLSVTQVAPDRFSMTITMPEIGTITRCADAGVCWESSPITGARLIEGEEREAFLREADTQSVLHPEKYFTSVECTEIVDVDGKPAYKVVMKTKNDLTETNYYDRESKLVVQTERESITPMGKISMTAKLSDYREVDGSKLPFRTEVTFMGQSQVITIQSVTINGEVDESVFERPAEVQQLLESSPEETAPQ